MPTHHASTPSSPRWRLALASLLGTVLFAAVLTGAALVAGCGGDSPDDRTDVGDVGDADADAEGDAAPDADADEDLPETELDVARDGDAEDGSGADAPPEPVPVPFEVFAEAPLAVDAPFVQEANHTTPEVDPAVPLVAVFVPPDGSSLPTPATAAPDGLVVPVEGGFGRIRPSTDDALVFAGAVGDEVLVVTETGLERLVGGELQPLTVAAGFLPDSFATLDGAAWILARTTPGDVGALLRWEPGGEVEAVPWGAGADAVGTAGAQVVIAVGDTVSGFAPDLGASEPAWSVTVEGVAPVRAIVGDLALPTGVDVAVFGASGFAGIAVGDGSASEVEVELFEAGRVPLTDVRGATLAPDGGPIVFGVDGAERILDRGDGAEWRVYPAERWLPSEDVRGAAADRSDPLGDVWFATAAGLATVTATETTLEAKLGPFIDRLVNRHSREGAVSDSHLLVRGDLDSNVPWDSDNDGGWTAYWLFTECYRWKVTGAEDARANFDEALNAMLRLHDLTGTDYFLARAVIRREGCMLDDCDDPDDGEWFLSPDEDFWVKGDTSNDEVIAHAFMMGPAYDLCATEEQQARIARHIGNVVGGIVDHGFQLVDIDGEVTTFGQFEPAYVNDHPGGRFGDGGLRSAEMLALLTLADYLTGDPRFDEAKLMLIDEHGYADNAVRASEYPGARHSGDRDELSTMAWFVLLRYESDPVLRASWEEGWRRIYSQLRLQQGAWWDTANAMLGGPEPTMDAAVRWLQTAPIDLIRWNVHNGHRADLADGPGLYRFLGRMRSDGRILPYDERACERWNTNQFRIDGGHGGWTEMDGADITAPYWMARYYGYIAGP